MTERNELFPGKQFISTILHALDTKTAMSSGLARVYLMRAAMAGVIIGVMYVAYYTVIGAFAGIGDGSWVEAGRLVGAVVFGFALVFIYYTKSELLTSNMMIVSIGAYYRRTTVGRSARILTLCLAGNAVGGLFLATLVAVSTLTEGRVDALMVESVDHKLGFLTEGATGLADLFVRAVLCNFMINVAMLMVYNGRLQDDVSKSVVMIMSVFLFAVMGFEHSVANTVLFAIVGMSEGIDIGLALGNLGVVLLGNMVGGGLLIGWYYAYANDARRHTRGAPEGDDV